MSDSVNNSNDEQTIRQMMQDWSNALERLDVDAMMTEYAEDTVLYDAIPPYKTVGLSAVKAAWKNCLPHFPENFRSEHRDVVVHVEGDSAFAYGLHHFVTETPHPAGQTWMRFTIGYRRVDGRWKVVHEHVSVPFNPMTEKVFYVTDPNRLDAPDYSTEACGAGVAADAATEN